jgi:hypothetical protein
MLHTFFSLPSHGQDPDAGFDRELDALGVLDLPASLVSVEEVASSLDAPFFSLDLARGVGGDWVAIEVGDGGASRLPDALDLVESYGALVSLLA